MEQWKDAASQQVKLLARRLNEELSKGLGWLRSELGVDLGLKPELIPPWAIVLAACTGLLLMVALWASVCRAVFKKRPAVRPADDGAGIKQSVSKPVKSDEPKKKKKKVCFLSRNSVNGFSFIRADPYFFTNLCMGPCCVCTWETKVSNKEKREQRKKDKSSSDGSSSPGGGNTPVSVPPEQTKTTSAGIPAPTNQKKKQGSWFLTGYEHFLFFITDSDWNAPSEAWGNYEEPTTETPLAQEKPLPESSKFIQIGAAVSPPRLRVALHLSQTASAVTRGERSVKDAPPPITQVPQKSTEGEPTAKQNNLPTPTLQSKQHLHILLVGVSVWRS
uniref:Metadherin a n=1 Tax=Oryzias latipes TaxID=8090 RepID=A0A3P9JVC3_ORYLA